MRVRRRSEREPDPGGASTPQGVPQIVGYTDLAVIGHGGSATVYRALQGDFGRTVAIKVIHVDASNRKAQRRFTSERELNGRLSDHPNVVTVLDSGFVDGRSPYLAMEYFELGSLADRLTQRGPLDVDTALHIGVRICGALESAHRLGILHRDVKPQNILLSRYGEPALADFGIATMLELDQSFTHALTPVHAAPEVLEGADPTAAADVYSLASTLYTLLAGAPPFAGPAGEGMLAQLLRITTSDLPAFARSDVPPSLTAVLVAATAKHPDERIASAVELGQRLQAVQAELGLPVTPLPIEGTGLQSAAVTAPLAPEAADTGTAAFATPLVAAASEAPEPADPSDPAPGGAPVAAHMRSPDVATWTAPSPATAPEPRHEAAGNDPTNVVPGAAARDTSGPALDTGDITVGHEVDAPTVAARQLHARREREHPRRRRRTLAIGAAVAAGVALVVGVVVAAPWRDDDSTAGPTTAPVDTSTGQSSIPGSTIAPTATTGATPGGDDDALPAPSGLTAEHFPESDGWLLGWDDAPDTDGRQVVFIGLADGRQLTEVPMAGSNSHVVEADVAADEPVCFIVANVFAGGDGDTITAQSEPVCRNGAVITTDVTQP